LRHATFSGAITIGTNLARTVRPAQCRSALVVRTACRRQFLLVRGLFGDAEWSLLSAIVLADMAMARYATEAGLSVNLAKVKLLAGLDPLVEWFGLRPGRGAA
jgi:hypothetical protein